MSVMKCFYSVTFLYIITTALLVLCGITVFRDATSEIEKVKQEEALPNLITRKEKNNGSRMMHSTEQSNSDTIFSKLKKMYTGRRTWQKTPKHHTLTKRQANDTTTDSLVHIFNTTVKTATERQIYQIVLYSETKNSLVRLSSGLNMQTCFHFKNCVIVQQDPIENDYIEGDAIVVQAGRIPKNIPKHRDENQVFVFASLESPEYIGFVNPKEKRYHNYFNWTMTYRFDSSIPYLYGSIVPKSFRMEDLYYRTMNYSSLNMRINSTYIDDIYNRPVGKVGKNYSVIFKQKEKLALWLVSHCSTASKREIYIKEMKKYVDIDTNSACYEDGSVLCPKEDNNTCDVLLTHRYKFYLSFENSLCTDYITEKVFKWFQRDIVTVVRGARQYDRFLPKGTYIDTNDFASPKELALYLNKLGANETEYTTFLKRKDSYNVVGILKHVQLSYCQICYKLNNLNYYRNVVPDIHDWWSKSCVKGKEITDLY